MQDSDIFLKMLQDKESVIAEILKDFSQCQKAYGGLENFIKKIDGADDVNFRHYFKTVTKVLRKQSSILTRVIMLLLVYTQGDNFNSDAAHALIKLGRGQEAVQEMFRRKREGR